ncbi:MAG: hypothetical protein OXE97_07475 [Gammaproteobacteria bacterium]|nr:hypothetical protein [Gammaproteobacteria bacterium]
MAPPAIARAQVGDLLRLPQFDAAVRARTVGDWPMAVISQQVENAIAGAGATTAAQIVTSKIKAGKFNRHQELNAERLRNVQDALDYGEVLIEPPDSYDRQGNRYTLIAYYEDDGWWRHVIEIDQRQLLLKTVFRDDRRDDVMKRKGLVTVRPWDEDRWQQRGK